MPKIKSEPRVERFSIPFSTAEKRLISRAAKILGETPAAYARDTLKRLSRQVLQRAGLKVRLDEPEAPEIPQDAPEPDRIPASGQEAIASPEPARGFRWPTQDDEED